MTEHLDSQLCVKELTPEQLDALEQLAALLLGPVRNDRHKECSDDAHRRSKDSARWELTDESNS